MIDAVTVIEAVLALETSSVEVAVMEAMPAELGVKTPDAVIVPPVAVQETVELKAPVPLTDAVQVLV